MYKILIKIILVIKTKRILTKNHINNNNSIKIKIFKLKINHYKPSKYIKYHNQSYYKLRDNK